MFASIRPTPVKKGGFCVSGALYTAIDFLPFQSWKYIANMRFRPIMVFCMAMCIMPYLSHGQETADTQAIRALMTADQVAWKSGDAEGVLSLMDEHYCVFSIPKVNGQLDFHGVEVGAIPDDFKKYLGDPAWKGHPGVEAMADTALDWETSHQLARIDVKGRLCRRHIEDRMGAEWYH
tara:strand:- start:505 stop:1038 length:534 start_codon:yes stop_codon:yes gene_type:complete